MQEMLDAIKGSEFRFMRSSSEVPFMPLGWLQDQYYPHSTFKAEHGGLPEATAAENTLSLGALFPAYVARRDMLLAGGNAAWDRIAVNSGPYNNQSVLSLTPVVAWLHQFGQDDMAVAFAAPIFSKELRRGEQWGTSGYGGVIGVHWYSDEYQLLYGGVYQNSFGQHAGYPYLGLNWLPTPRWAIAIVFPWPTVTYSLSDRWLLQLGIAPGGSSWVRRDGDFETTESLGSWNFTAGAGYRFYKRLWLFASAGVAGLRAVTMEGGGNRDRLESKPGAVFTLAVQFRP